MTEIVKKNSVIQDVTSRLGVVGELMAFLWKRKLFWLIPMLLILVIFAVTILMGSAGPAGMFFYPLF